MILPDEYQPGLNNMPKQTRDARPLCSCAIVRQPKTCIQHAVIAVVSVYVRNCVADACLCSVWAFMYAFRKLQGNYLTTLPNGLLDTMPRLTTLLSMPSMLLGVWHTHACRALALSQNVVESYSYGCIGLYIIHLIVYFGFVFVAVGAPGATLLRSVSCDWSNSRKNVQRLNRDRERKYGSLSILYHVIASRTHDVGQKPSNTPIPRYG